MWWTEQHWTCMIIDQQHFLVLINYHQRPSHFSWLTTKKKRGCVSSFSLLVCWTCHQPSSCLLEYLLETIFSGANCGRNILRFAPAHRPASPPVEIRDRGCVILSTCCLLHLPHPGPACRWRWLDWRLGSMGWSAGPARRMTCLRPHHSSSSSLCNHLYVAEMSLFSKACPVHR